MNNWEDQDLRLALDKKYGIKRMDENNLVLFENVVRVKKDTNEEYDDEKVLGYYSTLRESLRAYSKHSVRASGSQDIKSLIKCMDKIENAVISLHRDFTNNKDK